MYKEDRFIAGVQIKREKSLSEINVLDNGIPLRNYSITTDKYSILSVTEKNGDQSKSYNPIVFSYLNDNQPHVSYSKLNAKLSVGKIESRNAATISGDFDADGKMDFILYPTFGPDKMKKFWLYTDLQSGNTNLGSSHDVGLFETIFTSNWLSWDNKVMQQGWTIATTDPATQITTLSTYALSSMNTILPQGSKSFKFPEFIYYSEHPSSCLQPDREPFEHSYRPSRRYANGDFNGDGLTDVLAIEVKFTYSYDGPCDTNGNLVRVTSTNPGDTYFMNLDRRLTSKHTNHAGSLNVSETSKLLVADFNGDGKSDIFVIDEGFVNIYGLDDKNKLVLLYKNQTVDPDISLSKPILIGDYNGDGKFEFITPKAYGSATLCTYTSDGLSLRKEEKPFNPDFKANDANNTYDYIALDYDNDHRTDLISIRSSTNPNTKKGDLFLNGHSNLNGEFRNAATWSCYSNSDPDINKYALPVYLPQNSSYNGVSHGSNNFEIAFINKDKIHFFNSEKRYGKNNLLVSVTTGNDIKETIKYTSLNPRSYSTYPYNTIYTPSTGTENYPNIDMVWDANFMVVSQIEKQSKDVLKKRLFAYYGAVSNYEGLGFLGFRAITQTEWFDQDSKMISNVLKFDISKRGALLERSQFLGYRSPVSFMDDYITKSAFTYESDLLANKVFKLKNTITKDSNTLNGTTTETVKVYDENSNVTNTKTTIQEGATVAHTTSTAVIYEPLLQSPYILGRPLSKTVTSTTPGSSMTNKEVYTYGANQLVSSIDRSADGTAVITESRVYDSFGNTIQNTMSDPAPLAPRTTRYEYDASGRHITKMIDTDALETVFVYNPDGTLQSETTPFSATSYTYDSWFKRITATNDKLNKTITTTYTKNAEKTIVTTTTDALDGSATEETFDDLGRKIKSGVKNLNGVFSYISYEYDVHDRNYKVSEPYFDALPSQWNEVEYDAYGRVTNSKSFNGKSIATSYLGLTSTIVDGQKTKTMTNSANGTLSTLSETLGGSITYSYFANGNLKQASYNGVNIVTEQDGWGRRTKLTNPSSGTFTYVHNDFGELTTETSQNGGVVTTLKRDEAGKVINKTIVGAGTNSETNYTYDPATKLILRVQYVDKNEPVATGTTITTFVYDDIFKRVTSITEEKLSVTKFTRSFTYDGLGRIDTETKTAELNGKVSTVVTKNVYKNGALWQIVDNATNKILWQTNILNAKGQIRESEMGNGIKMTSEFDENGYLSKIQYDKTTAPSANILTLTTSFDKNTDNLTSRSNSAFNNYTETFQYDEIDRLQEFTNRLGEKETQTYDPAGKILTNNLGTYKYEDSRPYRNTFIELNANALDYYQNRGVVFYDGMESQTGWSTNKYSSREIKFVPLETSDEKHALQLETAGNEKRNSVTADKIITINNEAATKYVISGWVKTTLPKAEIQVLEYKNKEKKPFVTETVSTKKAEEMVFLEKMIEIPAEVKQLRIRVNVIAGQLGEGSAIFDEISIRKVGKGDGKQRKLSVTYNAFKSPIEISETGIDRISFTYNEDNQRSTMYYGSLEDKELRPLRKHYSADGSMEIKENRSTGALEFVTFIGGNAYTAPVVSKSDGIDKSEYLYLHRDYQGSILAITDANATLVEKRLFDAWGSIIKVEDGKGNELPELTILDRGYTGHEHLQSVALINMNARLYDPMLHRFLQVDNYIQDPTNTQNFNQYGYVLNNPLKYTDPSGNKFKLTFSDIVAGLEIVAGAIMVAASSVTYGATYIASASLIAAGGGHFAVTAVQYSQTKDWVSASNNAGLTFGIKFDTDFGYDGAKADVKNGDFYSNNSYEKIAGKTNEVATSTAIFSAGLEASGRAAPYMKGIGKITGNIAPFAQASYNTIKVIKGEANGGISPQLYSYRMIGTGASWGAGTAITTWGAGGAYAGPYGVLAGIVIGAGFEGIEYSYSIIAPQIQESFNHFFNAINSGNFVK
ncbi:hypothetical protein B0A66_11175 [Flavobacterium hercynium]|uniref:Insecticide toxin TcdB middle/N-terminal domain-containing protein n=1 Tax=Flavobacterium hercynium TaxID=387094 RepID=A0A226HC78_9FLAO|nr:hypothetical protein B0A66_11175 [Flavobacterium hercynium]